MRAPLLVLLIASAASAHDADVVYVQLLGREQVILEAMTMTAATLGQLAPVDADGDGALSADDVKVRGEAITAGVWNQMPLTAGGAPCVFSNPRTLLRENFIELTAEWRCGEGELVQEFKWLRILSNEYRVVLGSQVDGERGKTFAQGMQQKLFIPRPGAKVTAAQARAPLVAGFLSMLSAWGVWLGLLALLACAEEKKEVWAIAGCAAVGSAVGGVAITVSLSMLLIAWITVGAGLAAGFNAVLKTTLGTGAVLALPLASGAGAVAANDGLLAILGAAIAAGLGVIVLGPVGLFLQRHTGPGVPIRLVGGFAVIANLWALTRLVF